MDHVLRYWNVIQSSIVNHFKTVSSTTLGWIAVVLLHCAFVPNLLSVLLGVSDRLPSIDVVLFVWSGLFLFFIRALMLRDMMNIFINGIGFFVQAILLAFIVFK